MCCSRYESKEDMPRVISRTERASARAIASALLARELDHQRTLPTASAGSAVVRPHSLTAGRRANPAPPLAVVWASLAAAANSPDLIVSFTPDSATCRSICFQRLAAPSIKTDSRRPHTRRVAPADCQQPFGEHKWLISASNIAPALPSAQGVGSTGITGETAT